MAENLIEQLDQALDVVIQNPDTVRASGGAEAAGYVALELRELRELSSKPDLRRFDEESVDDY